MLSDASMMRSQGMIWAVSSFETQMSPMTTDTHGYHDLCSSFFIGAICVEIQHDIFTCNLNSQLELPQRGHTMPILFKK